MMLWLKWMVTAERMAVNSCTVVTLEFVGRVVAGVIREMFARLGSII